MGGENTQRPIAGEDTSTATPPGTRLEQEEKLPQHHAQAERPLAPGQQAATTVERNFAGTASIRLHFEASVLGPATTSPQKWKASPRSVASLARMSQQSGETPGATLGVSGAAKASPRSVPPRRKLVDLTDEQRQQWMAQVRRQQEGQTTVASKTVVAPPLHPDPTQNKNEPHGDTRLESRQESPLESRGQAGNVHDDSYDDIIGV